MAHGLHGKPLEERPFWHIKPNGHKTKRNKKMNSDYIISGKGQTALMGASWGAKGGAASTDTPHAEGKAASSAKTAAARPTELAEARRNRGPDVQTNTDISFNDLVDIINPLQHIPLVNMAYRAITGDKISGFAQIAGSALYGGPLGIVSGAANAIVQDEKGDDIGGTVIAALTGTEKNNSREPLPSEPSGDVMVAENTVDADETALLSSEPEDAPEAAPLAENSAKIEARPLLADAKDILDKKPQAKKPFGGIYDSAIADATKAGAPSIADSHEVALAGATPLGHGQKFYSLANVEHRGAGQEPRMPLADSPDVRLKPLNRVSVGKPIPPKAQELLADIPLAPKDQTAKVLGLDASHAAPEVAQTPVFPTKGQSNPLPPQLIQDMMQMGIQKYQKGIESGQFAPPPAVDING
jgi:hypothetical protein